MVSVVNTFAGDGVTLAFQLAYIPVAPMTKVTVNAVLMIEGVDYKVDYTTGLLTFTLAPDDQVAIVIIYSSTLQKTFDEVANAVLAELATTQTDMTDFNVGSIGRNMIEAVASQIGTSSTQTESLYAVLESVYESGFVGTAVGTDLEQLVALVGITRLTATKAIGTATFTRVVGTTGNIIIAAGTRLSTVKSGTSQPVYFVTTAQVTLPDGNTDIDADVIAETAALEGNVGAGSLTVIVTPITNVASVTNAAAASGGLDIETDEALRARASAALNVAGKATAAAIKGVVEAVAGIQTAIVDDLALLVTAESHTHTSYAATPTFVCSETPVNFIKKITGTRAAVPYTFVQGVDYTLTTPASGTVTWVSNSVDPDDGTTFLVTYEYSIVGCFDVVLAGTTSPISSAVLENVDAAILATKAAGINYTRSEAEARSVAVTCTVTKQTGLVSDAVEAEVVSAVTNYLNSLLVGEDVLRAQLYKVIMGLNGVVNVSIAVPAADVTIYAGEKTTAGTITVSVV